MITIHFSSEALESYIKANVCPLKRFVNDKEEKLILRTRTQKKEKEKVSHVLTNQRVGGTCHYLALLCHTEYFGQGNQKIFSKDRNDNPLKPMGNIRVCFLVRPLKFPEYSILKDLNYTIQKGW